MPNVPWQTESDAMWDFKDLGNDSQCPRNEQKHLVNVSSNCKAAKKQVQWNLRVSMGKIALEVEISDQSVHWKFNFSQKKTHTPPQMPKTFQTKS